eukprot:UN13449
MTIFSVNTLNFFNRLQRLFLLMRDQTDLFYSIIISAVY